MLSLQREHNCHRYEMEKLRLRGHGQTAQSCTASGQQSDALDTNISDLKPLCFLALRLGTQTREWLERRSTANSSLQILLLPVLSSFPGKMLSLAQVSQGGGPRTWKQDQFDLLGQKMVPPTSFQKTWLT